MGQAKDEKEELIKHLKHEIKNYLASSMAFLDLSFKRIEAGDSLKAKDYLGRVKKSLERMNKFLDDLSV